MPTSLISMLSDLSVKLSRYLFDGRDNAVQIKDIPTERVDVIMGISFVRLLVRVIARPFDG